MDKVRKTKMEIKPVILSQGLDKSFTDILLHARSMSYDQTPDYQALKKSLRAGLERLKARYVYVL